MNYYYLFFGFFGLYYILATIYIVYNKDKTDKIMRREHPHYSGKFTSSFDDYRIIYVYFTSKGLTKKEKSFLRIRIIIFAISFVLWVLFMVVIYKLASQ